MFPSSNNRFRSAARRGIDLAVEFATLGEYGLPEAPTPPRRPGSRGGAVRRTPLRPPRPAITLSRTAVRLSPATAAARRQRVPAPVTPVAPAEGLRSLAFAADGLVAGPRPRVRAGQAVPAPQPCVAAEQ